MSGRRACFVPPARVAGAVVDLLGGARAEIPEWLVDGYEPSLGSSELGGAFVAFRCTGCHLVLAFARAVPLKASERLELRNHALAHVRGRRPKADGAP